MTKGAGASVLIVAETSNCIHGDRAMPLSRRPRLAKADWAGYGAKMTEFAERARRRGPEALLSSPYGHHRPVGTATSTRSWRTPRRPCTCCSTPATHAGAAPTRRRLRGAYRERIGHVHCKDVREAKMRESNAGDWSFLDSILGMGEELGVYTVPGDGMIDYVGGVQGAQRLFRLGRAGSRTGPEKGAGAALREEGRRAPPRVAEGSRAELTQSSHLRSRARQVASPACGRKRRADEHAKLTQEAASWRNRNCSFIPAGAADGVGHHITPESAGWSYVGFETRTLKQGAQSKLDTAGNESLRRSPLGQGAGDRRRFRFRGDRRARERVRRPAMVGLSAAPQRGDDRSGVPIASWRSARRRRAGD